VNCPLDAQGLAFFKRVIYSRGMALRSDWSQSTCSMARGLDILGDPWGMLVLREVFFGNGRFDAMKERLRVADSVLTKRLAAVVESGLLT
jgi:DNA-binding HxlR family transcriptional regulator